MVKSTFNSKLAKSFQKKHPTGYASSDYQSVLYGKLFLDQYILTNEQLCKDGINETTYKEISLSMLIP